MWISAASPGGTANISGNSNTLVFHSNASPTITVTGTGNTFYIPEGSAIKLEGLGAALSTVLYYKP